MISRPNTGVAVGDLVVLQQEFANAGKSAEDIGPVFGKMAKSLQGGSADDTIKKLGIHLDELRAEGRCSGGFIVLAHATRQRQPIREERKARRGS